ncbi:hypothetical protein GCM10010245_28570 [Streptomyces spectabilis]|nr:hypothetical protein GCM10010245_28570 [Streptomyces spectabilis]
MAAEAEGAVDDDGSRPGEGRGQQVQAPLEHHRDVSTAAQGALSGPAGVVRTVGSPPARRRGTGMPAPGAASADREREEAEPYVRATHVGNSANLRMYQRGAGLRSRFASL